MAEAADTFGEFYRQAGPDNVASLRSVAGQGELAATVFRRVHAIHAGEGSALGYANG